MLVEMHVCAGDCCVTSRETWVRAWSLPPRALLVTKVTLALARRVLAEGWKRNTGVMGK